MIKMQPTTIESKREFTPKLIERTESVIEDPKAVNVVKATNDLVNFAF